MTQTTPELIADGMDGILRQVAPGRQDALLPSPSVQNHAAFLSECTGSLQCLWFGGSLEGKSDISIHRSSLSDGVWGKAELLTSDSLRSEQNPVQFCSPDGRVLLFHTAQPGGNQDSCVVRMREIGQEPIDLPLPKGTFIRSPVHVREDGAWLLGLFRCVPVDGSQWTGSHDTAALAISEDSGRTWREVEVPGSMGCVHMSIVSLGGGRMTAFFRRRQADYVFRSTSQDGGESWSIPVSTDVPNNNSSISAIRLLDGRIAMACNPANAAMHPDSRRASLYDELGEDSRPRASGGCDPTWGVPRAPMAICLSDNEGFTFPQRVIVENGLGHCLTNNSIDGRNSEMSYPALTEQADGTLHLAYTYHRRAIRHVCFAPGYLADQ